MDMEVGFGRFVALNEHDAPDLLQRMSKDDLPVDGERYGVVTRLIARPATTVADLAVAVLRKLARETGRPAADWGGMVLSSRVVDVRQVAEQAAERLRFHAPVEGPPPAGRVVEGPPPAGCVVEGPLPAGCVVEGIERACSGFPAATERAVELCRRLRRPIAIAAVEIISGQINWEPADGNLADQQRARGQASKLFGDGAAAVLVTPGEMGRTHAILDAWAGEVADDKQLIQKLDVPDTWDPWGRVRPGPTTCISMPGRRGFLLFKRAPKIMADAVRQSLQRVGPPHAPSRHVVPHQANGLIMQALRDELDDLSAECQVWNCFRDCGNTVSASIPLAMAGVQDRLPPGELVALPAVGAGGPGYRPDVLSTGCVLIRTAAAAGTGP